MRAYAANYNITSANSPTSIVTTLPATLAGASGSTWAEVPHFSDRYGTTKTRDGLLHEVFPAGTNSFGVYISSYEQVMIDEPDVVLAFVDYGNLNSLWAPWWLSFAPGGMDGLPPFPDTLVWDPVVVIQVAHQTALLAIVDAVFDVPSDGYNYALFCDPNGTHTTDPSTWLVNDLEAPRRAGRHHVLFGGYTASILRGTKFFLVRYAKPVQSMTLGLGSLGIGVGVSGGLTGPITVPIPGGSATVNVGGGTATGSVTIGNTTVSVGSGGAVTVNGSPVGGGTIDLGGGITGTADSTGLTLDIPAAGNIPGATVHVNPDGSGSITLSNGAGIAVGSNGQLSVRLPPGTPPLIVQTVDILGKILQAGRGVVIKVDDVLGVLGLGKGIVPVDVSVALSKAGIFKIGVQIGDSHIFWFDVNTLPAPALAVDANRDGNIAFDASDVTTTDRPNRFWINDDDDNADSVADANDGVVNGVADLDDFYPVFLDLKSLVGAMPPSSSVKYKLKQDDGVVNFVYTNLTRATAFSYVGGALSTGFGPSFNQAASSASVQQVPATGVELSSDFLSRIANQDQGVILMEGRQMSDKPLVLQVEKDGNVVAEARLEMVAMHLGKLWETANKANQIFNPTAKDDPWGGDGYGGPGPQQNGAPRNTVFLVPNPQDNKYAITLEVGIPSTRATGMLAAAYVGNSKVANSDTVLNSQGRFEIAFEHLGSSQDIENFVLRVGHDTNANGTLDQNEIVKITVMPGGEPTVRGTRTSKYTSAKGTIDGIISGSITSVGTGIFLPHAKRFLEVFRDGHTNAADFPADKKPTSSTTVSFNAFNGYFAEWLTHNSGAPFDDAGAANIIEYTWDRFKSAADLVATSPQIEPLLRTFYNSTVQPLATSYFANLPIGSVAYYPSSTGFYDISHAHESPAWVPATTLTFDRSWLWDKIDDLNGTLGRGRLLSHKARYRVEKKIVYYDSPETGPYSREEPVVTQVISQGAVIDRKGPAGDLVGGR